MYGIISEHQSDYEMLKVIVKRLLNNQSMPVKGRGFGGSGNLLKNGAAMLMSLNRDGCDKLIVCLDADGAAPKECKGKVTQLVIAPSGLKNISCALVPVQEIEAWIFADIKAVTNLFPSWKPKPINRQPESIQSPKEELERLSRCDNQKPRYSHATHNPLVAKHLDLEVVHRLCPSFRVLKDFVANKTPGKADQPS